MRSEAVIFRSPGVAVVEEIELPPMNPEDVLVQIESSSISTGTERWCLNGKIQVGPDQLIRFPFVTGYQAAGTVLEVGSAVEGFRNGDRIFSPWTRLGPEWRGSWGGHVGHHVVRAGSIIKLPDTVSTREASGLVLAQVGYNGAMRPAMEEGDIAVVIGDGLVGQYAAQVLRHRGARVIMSGHHDFRLQMAKSYSADETVNSNEVDFFDYLREKHPTGVSIAVETASKSSLIREAVGSLKYEGQLVVLGYYPAGECLMDIHWTRLRETTVYFPNSWTLERLKATLALIEGGQMKVEELITHEFSQGEAPDAYRMLNERSSEFLGLVIRWNQ